MKLGRKIIARSWASLVDAGAQNKIFGLLCLLHSIKTSEPILSGVDYSLDTIKLCGKLDGIFSLDKNHSTSYGSHDHHVIFSQNWSAKATSIFNGDKKLPLIWSAIFFMQNEIWRGDESIQEITSSFRNKLKLSIGDFQNIFTEKGALSEEILNDLFEEDWDFSDIRNWISISSSSKIIGSGSSLTFENNHEFSATSKPSELTRGPFFQPLYAGQKNLEVLLLAPFSLKDQYPFGKQDDGVNMSELNVAPKTKNLILHGPPGTGKTYHTSIHALSMITGSEWGDLTQKPRHEISQEIKKFSESGQLQFITFHQSYGYEEFVEGIRAETKNGSINYEIRNGVFVSLCSKASENWQAFICKEAALKQYVLIIDEINRGNISRIFGELISLIEPEHRLGSNDPLEVTLAYSGNKLSIPPNLHIIGTMNTSDRSIALMDIALRRRFDFIEMEPREDLLANLEIEGISIEKILRTINQRIEILHDKEHRIGHAYFLSLKNNGTFDELVALFLNKIIPLLQEYFFDDWRKIALILGDSEEQGFKSHSDVFIRTLKYRGTEIFNQEIEGVDDESFETFIINRKPTKNSFRGIYEMTTNE